MDVTDETSSAITTTAATATPNDKSAATNYLHPTIWPATEIRKMSLPEENYSEENVSENPREEEIDQDIERVLFLKSFAEDPTKSYKHYAREFNLPDSEAYDYVKKFVWLMIHTWNEDDGAEKVAAVLNDGVKSRLDHITIQEVEAL
jgi:hypothetical protein